MKNLLLASITLITILFTSFASATTILPSFYPVEFEVISVTPMCPQTNNQVSCMALGSIVRVKAVLRACADRVIFFKPDYFVDKNHTLVVQVSALAEFRPDLEIYCIVPNTVYKDILVRTESFDEVELLNGFML